MMKVIDHRKYALEKVGSSDNKKTHDICVTILKTLTLTMMERASVR